MSTSEPIFTAGYRGWCHRCGWQVRPGDQVTRIDTRTVHAACLDRQTEGD